MKSIKTKFKIRKKGLTMVETLVAISILTIAVIGPLGIIAQALHTSYYTRDQMTAYYLAQEAIEYVKNLRDNQGIKITDAYINNKTDPGPWLNGVVSPSSDIDDPITKVRVNNSGSIVSYKYSLVKENGLYKFIPYSDTDFLKVSNGIYGDITSANATTSIFKREIYFVKVSPSATNNPDYPQEFTMVVNVYWKSGSYPITLTLKENLTNSASKTGI